MDIKDGILQDDDGNPIAKVESFGRLTLKEFQKKYPEYCWFRRGGRAHLRPHLRLEPLIVNELDKLTA